MEYFSSKDLNNENAQFLLLDRLQEALKEVGVEQGSRNRTVAEKTGYSEKTVGNLLSGNSKLTNRFLRTVCEVFNIRPEWLAKGDLPIIKLKITVSRLLESDELEKMLPDEIRGALSEWKDRNEDECNKIRSAITQLLMLPLSLQQYRSILKFVSDTIGLDDKK
ncbi:MAG: hypothetical protein A2076_01655 [Geobacteraceae bacterium GWC2_53_11]|nr:MAG: hypothetical protein A2076_01655 [Geobacteraceae bacterium GWC2_53_11]